jgi:hypothetical protein
MKRGRGRGFAFALVKTKRDQRARGIIASGNRCP